jgi:hypothetical protein
MERDGIDRKNLLVVAVASEGEVVAVLKQMC